MKKSNIEKTKKSLSVAFSLIVFITVFVMGASYFSTKYLNEMRMDRGEFFRFVDGVEKAFPKVDNMKIGTRFEFMNAGVHHGMMGLKILETQGFGVNMKGFVNYIIIQENEVIASDIKDDIPENILSSAINTDNYLEKSKVESGYLIRTLKTDTGRISIFIRKLDYSFNDYISDMLGFLLVCLLFTIIVYFIGRKFVNKVFVPVEENMKDMNDFVHNAGHELKTPISVIDSNVQLFLDTKKYDEEMMLELKSEIKKLNGLIESLLNLSDIDSFENTDNLNLKEIVDEIISDYRLKIEDKNITTKVSIDENVEVAANRPYFYIFLSNIIGNAVKYNKDGGEIDITYISGKLTIKDTGIGIKEEELDKIFNRFYKSDESRNSEGFGIGLSLVKKIASLYDWNIEVVSKDKRTSFIIKF